MNSTAKSRNDNKNSNDGNSSGSGNDSGVQMLFEGMESVDLSMQNSDLLKPKTTSKRTLRKKRIMKPRVTKKSAPTNLIATSIQTLVNSVLEPEIGGALDETDEEISVLEKPTSIQYVAEDPVASQSASTEIKIKEEKISPKSKTKREKKQYICHICNKNFLGITDLKRHLLVHTGEKPHQCPSCEKRFRQAVCLKNHIAAVHSNDFQFKCTKCPKKFPIKFRLRLHMRTHSGEKPYKCPLCPKVFARDGQLRQHKVTHTENCHRCITCNETFETKPELHNHMQNHIKPVHVCQICQKTFSKQDLLRGHLFRTHANLKFCTICNKALKGHLAQHLKLHANERPFTCEICEAQFSQKSQLNVHQRMHSGERPYKCQVCWQAFAHSTVLKLHIRKHTGEKPFACHLCKKKGIAFSQLAHLKTHMRTIHHTEKPYVCEGCLGFFKNKAELDKHQKKCKKYAETVLPENILKNIQNYSETSTDGQGMVSMLKAIEQQKLSKLRLLVAILLKKISTEERLKQLGFEKRLIDNVIVTALKLASRKYHDDVQVDDLKRLRMNVEEFLNWTVPPQIMAILSHDKNSIEEILENIVSAYPQG